MYFPRICLSYFVLLVAQLLRMVARVLGIVNDRVLANRRILVISDYMPPQTHGIAVRVQAYVKEMRAQGHEVVVFTTSYDQTKETSWDHPNLPYIVNPFNLKNYIGYNPGVKLAWYLGACPWDVVHLVFPSLIGAFVIGACELRQIPVYCSHHVDMETYCGLFGGRLKGFGLFMYNLIAKWHACRWATLNSAPTLTFAKDHVGTSREDRLRVTPSGVHEIFKAEPASPSEREEVRKSRFGVDDERTKVVLLVQRLSPEKGTRLVLNALQPHSDDDDKPLETLLVFAGDGLSRADLEEEARQRRIPTVFLGNVNHHDLPAIYRAADCFVTMSVSETFGLTVLEAAMCGCPAAIPYCAVFDEIWDKKVPKAWRYDVNSAAQLSGAIKAAQEGGREYLSQHPVDMTWKKAASQLLAQYEECIALKTKKYKAHRQLVNLVDWSIRNVICVAVAAYFLQFYYPPFQRVVGVLTEIF